MGKRGKRSTRLPSRRATNRVVGPRELQLVYILAESVFRASSCTIKNHSCHIYNHSD